MIPILHQISVGDISDYHLERTDCCRDKPCNLAVKVDVELGIFDEFKARILHLPCFLKVIIGYAMIAKLCLFPSFVSNVSEAIYPYMNHLEATEIPFASFDKTFFPLSKHLQKIVCFPSLVMQPEST